MSSRTLPLARGGSDLPGSNGWWEFYLQRLKAENPSSLCVARELKQREDSARVVALETEVETTRRRLLQRDSREGVGRDRLAAARERLCATEHRLAQARVELRAAQKAESEWAARCQAAEEQAAATKQLGVRRPDSSSSVLHESFAFAIVEAAIECAPSVVAASRPESPVFDIFHSSNTWLRSGVGFPMDEEFGADRCFALGTPSLPDHAAAAAGCVSAALLGGFNDFVVDSA